MAIDYKASFSAGELDPALRERTTLKKYDTGLATARNTTVGKTGRVLSRAGRKQLIDAKNSNEQIRIHTVDHMDGFLEWGPLYVRWYDSDGTLVTETTHTWTGDQLADLRFIDVPRPDTTNTVVILMEGQQSQDLYMDKANLVRFTVSNMTDSWPSSPILDSFTQSASGYECQYAATVVKAGQESEVAEFNILISSSPPLVPLGWNSTSSTYEVNELKVKAGGSADDTIQEVRVYRRPYQGGAFGYIGSTTSFVTSGFDKIATFRDYGQEADYTNTPPTLNSTLRNENLVDASFFEAASGLVYQQRLILTRGPEIISSRTGFHFDFSRDYPLQADSSLAFKAGSEGYAKVRWTIEQDGLIAFTSKGVFLNRGGLSPANLALEKKGKWVIQEDLPPIAVPGGVLFMDESTNTVRQLLWSEEHGVYLGSEVSIFSDHLFADRKVVSWAFQGGRFPLLWTVFSDGTYASFTYEAEHEMRAWTRHDSSTITVEQVASIDDKIFFIVNKNGQRSVEVSVPRYVTADDLDSDSEADLGESIAFMDSMVTWKALLNDDLTDDDITVAKVTFDFVDGDVTVGTDTINHTDHHLKTGDIVNLTTTGTLPTGLSTGTEYYVIKVDDDNIKLAKSLADAQAGTAVDITAASGGGTHTVTGDWESNLTISVTDDAIFPSGGAGAVGEVFKHFHPDDKTVVELEIEERVSDNQVVVSPNTEFPSDYATNPRLYKTKNTFDGLDHMEGEDVSILADGNVLASPNNNIENYSTVTVSSGSVNLPDSYKGAIVHIGRPITSDVETLGLATVEQSPTLIESLTCNKVYVKTYKTRGLYVANRFPDNDKVSGSDVTGTAMVEMDGADAYDVNYEEEDPITGNRHQQPTSRRLEITLSGDYDTQGKVCLRQVDPVHWEVLSIIPDVEIHRR